MFERFDTLNTPTKATIIGTIAMSAIGFGAVMTQNSISSIYGGWLETHICKDNEPATLEAGTRLSTLSALRGYEGNQARAFELDTLQRVGEANITYDSSIKSFVMTKTVTTDIAKSCN